MAQAERLLDIVEFLVPHRSGLPLGEICDRLDLPKSAGHRLLATLIRCGYVQQDPDSARYQLTLKLAKLGFTQMAGLGLVEICQPRLDRMGTQTGELVRMSIVDEDRLLWVAKVQGAQSGLRYDPDMGDEVPLYCTATGHVWLASLRDEEALRIVYKQGWDPTLHGPAAPRTVEELLGRLNKVRQDGYAVVIDSGTLGAAAVAVPIWIDRGDRQVVATISVAGPTVRFTPKKVEEFRDLLLAAATELAEIWPLHLAHGRGHKAQEAAA